MIGETNLCRVHAISENRLAGACFRQVRNGEYSSKKAFKNEAILPAHKKQYRRMHTYTAFSRLWPHLITEVRIGSFFQDCSVVIWPPLSGKVAKRLFLRCKSPGDFRRQDLTGGRRLTMFSIAMQIKPST